MENPVINVRYLTKSFRQGEKDKQVLKGIDLEVYAGEVIGYLGTNGAGKSTTVKILCGILSDFEGEVNLMGHDVRKEALPLKRRIGYIPENATMYEHLTPVEYLEFIGTLYGLSKDYTDEKIRQMLTLFEMLDYANTRMTTFSKGMKQKIHLISGMLHDPDILFMDEPLNGLDANAVILMKEMITELAHQGKTIFYCSHLMDVVEKIASRIILLNDGMVMANGSIQELKNQTGCRSLEEVFAKLTHRQYSAASVEQIIDLQENTSL